jgi:hypothetical protein
VYLRMVDGTGIKTVIRVMEQGCLLPRQGSSRSHFRESHRGTVRREDPACSTVRLK